MFSRNPHGAGYMVATGKYVEIHKGFMNVSDLLRATKDFTSADVVVWHFRISTQAGVSPEMTQPFPLSESLDDLEALDVLSSIGVAHNGIIRMTSTGSPRYSDTALFISRYMRRLVRRQSDILDPRVQELLEAVTGSKMALLDKAGHVGLVGPFIREKSGLLFSNGSYTKITPVSGNFSGTHTYFSRKGL